MKRGRKRSFVILAGAALLVPALVLSLLGVKLLRDFSGITNSLRADYGSYLARIAAASVEDAFWEQEQINMVSARLVPPENPDHVVGFLNRFQRESPLYLDAFFVSPVGLVYYAADVPGGARAYRPAPDWATRPILASLVRHRNTPSGLVHLASPDTLAPAQVTYFTVHSGDGELLGAAAFLWDLEAVKRNRGFLDRVLVGRLNANPDIFRGSFFASPVAVTLLDETGADFYTTVADAGEDFIARRAFQRVLPFYEVGIQLSDDRFDSWVRTVVITNLVLIGIMFAAIVGAVFFSLRFIVHEMRLAELKSTFVSNVSHELKTPLALIRLFSETLEMGRVESPEREKEFLRIIGKESERLTHLINNVLDVRKIEEGQKSYRMTTVDLGQIVRETVASYEYQLREKGFTVATEIAAGPILAPADADALTQALLNLMDNAIKYSADSRFLRVAVEEQGREAVITVEDRGLGIPPGEQGKIFDKFYRVEKGLVHDVKGSGLGLSLVRHIVDAHGGRIAVSSRPGEGSTFSIRIPLGDGSSPRSDEEPTSGGKES